MCSYNTYSYIYCIMLFLVINLLLFLNGINKHVYKYITIHYTTIKLNKPHIEKEIYLYLNTCKFVYDFTSLIKIILYRYFLIFFT